MKTASFVLRKGSVPKKYDHINFVPPKGVRDEAKRGLKLRREHGRGGLSTKQASTHGIGSGVQRAATLASGGRVSPGTIKRMRSFFARHSAYKEHHKDRTSAAYISWLLWGGDAGERWANKVYAQMKRADEEMKKAVAGGERVGHKYIRRVRTARNGRMGWRYIYKKPLSKRPDSPSAESETTENLPANVPLIEQGDLDLAGVSYTLNKEPQGDAEDGSTIEVLVTSDSGGTQYAQLDTDSVFSKLDGADDVSKEFVELLLNHELSDLETAWHPEDLASAILDADIDHSRTLEDMRDAPMGEQELLSFDDDGPDLDAAAEQHEALTDTLRENPELEPLADTIDAIAPVKDGKINLPVKEVGKAIALLTLITAVEVYKTATVENDNAPDLNDLESASRRGLKQIDKDKIAEAKAKMRESLNKERQEARDKMTREKLAARLKERQEKNKAAKEAQERELEFRKQEEERKEQRKEEAKDKQTARREEAKDKQAARREEAKDKQAERKEKQKEKQSERKEAAERRTATRKKAEEKRAQKRKRAADLRKKAEKEQKEKDKERKEEKARERDATKKKKAEEAAAAKRQKEKDAEDKKKLDAFEARSQERKEEKEARKKRAAETPRKKRKEKRSEAAKEAKEERKLEKEKANKEKEKADKKKLEAFQEAAAQRAKKVPKRVPKRVRRGNR